jgi:beta-lactamase regulating signal transducer with metallopeptidase domain
MKAEFEFICDRIAAALLNGGYQGLLLAAIFWLALKLFPRTNAATRHAAAFAMLCLIAGLPLAHFFLDGERTSEVQEQTNVPFSVPMVRLREQLPPATPVPNFSNQAAFGAVKAETDSAVDQKRPSEWSSPTYGDDFPASALQSSNTEDQNAAVPWLTWRFSSPKYSSLVLIVCWVCGAGLFGLRLFYQFFAVHILKARGILASESLRHLFELLRAELKMSRTPRLMLSRTAKGPMALGFRHPAVLLPSRLVEEATGSELDQILRHELAHLARRDDWANLAQQFIKSLFFFQPAVWWLSRRLTVEREIACDDHVVAALKEPRSYALFLTEFASRTLSRDLALAPAAWSNKHQLKQRINMILDPKRNASPRLARAKAGLLAAVAALAAVLALYSAPRLVFAQEATPLTVAQTEVTVSDESVEAPAAPEAAELPIKAARPKRIRAKTAIVAPAALPSEPTLSSSADVALPPRPPSAHNGPVMASVPMPAAPSAGGAGVGFPGPYIAQGDVAPPPKPRKHKADGDESLEQRMDRLEKLVEKLLARDKAEKKAADVASKQFNYEVKRFDFKGPKFDEKDLEKMKAAKLSDEEIARIKEQAARDAERAVRDSERAVRDIERSNRDSQKRYAELNEKLASGQDSVEMQRKILESQRGALEKQMEALHRQMEQLNKQQEKLDHSQQERGRPDKERKEKRKQKDHDHDENEDRSDTEPKR